MVINESGIMKILISGYGKMGKMIEKIILSKEIEYAGWSESITETDPALAKECVCIDFTTPAAFRANYRFLAENFKAVVVGTTGWADILPMSRPVDAMMVPEVNTVGNAAFRAWTMASLWGIYSFSS